MARLPVQQREYQSERRRSIIRRVTRSASENSAIARAYVHRWETSARARLNVDIVITHCCDDRLEDGPLDERPSSNGNYRFQSPLINSPRLANNILLPFPLFDPPRRPRVERNGSEMLPTFRAISCTKEKEWKEGHEIRIRIRGESSKFCVTFAKFFEIQNFGKSKLCIIFSIRNSKV